MFIFKRVNSERRVTRLQQLDVFMMYDNNPVIFNYLDYFLLSNGDHSIFPHYYRFSLKKIFSAKKYFEERNYRVFEKSICYKLNSPGQRLLIDIFGSYVCGEIGQLRYKKIAKCL